MTLHNRTSFFHLLTLSCAGLLAFSSPAQASKAPELYFYPATVWHVDRGETGTNNANATSCRVGSEFNNGFIVQFDGSHKWVEQMQLDLRQAVLEQGQTYNVSLTVPGQLTKSIQGVATQASAITVNLQGQKDFYKAMRDAAVFDLGIEENHFRFYMTNFAGAAKKFETCMAGGDITPNADADSSAMASATTNESIAFEHQETGQVAITEVLPEEYASPAQQPGEPVVANRKTLAENAVDIKTPEPRQRLSEMLAQEIENDPSLVDMQADRQSLQMPPAMREPSEPIEMASKTPTAHDLLQKSETESHQGKTAEAMTPPPRKEIVIKRESNKFEADFTNLDQVEPASAPDSTMPMREVKAVAATPAYGGQADHELIKKIAQLEGMITSLQSENEALNEELKASLVASESERLAISSDNWNLERATMRFNEAERQIKRLGQQLQQERAQCAVEQKELEAMLFDPQVTGEQQLARLASLEEQLLQAQSKLDDQRTRYESRIMALENQLQIP